MELVNVYLDNLSITAVPCGYIPCLTIPEKPENLKHYLVCGCAGKVTLLETIVRWKTIKLLLCFR